MDDLMIKEDTVEGSVYTIIDVIYIERNKPFLRRGGKDAEKNVHMATGCC